MSKIQSEKKEVGGHKKRGSMVCGFGIGCCKVGCKGTHKEDWSLEMRKEVANRIRENREVLKKHFLELGNGDTYCLHSHQCYKQDCPYYHIYDFDGRKIIRGFIKDLNKEKNTALGVLTQAQKNSLLLKKSREEMTSEERERAETLEKKHAEKKAIRSARYAIEQPDKVIAKSNRTGKYEISVWEKTGVPVYSYDKGTSWADTCDC